MRRNVALTPKTVRYWRYLVLYGLILSVCVLILLGRGNGLTILVFYRSLTSTCSMRRSSLKIYSLLTLVIEVVWERNLPVAAILVPKITDKIWIHIIKIITIIDRWKPKWTKEVLYELYHFFPFIFNILYYITCFYEKGQHYLLIDAMCKTHRLSLVSMRF